MKPLSVPETAVLADLTNQLNQAATTLLGVTVAQLPADRSSYYLHMRSEVDRIYNELALFMLGEFTTGEQNNASIINFKDRCQRSDTGSREHTEEHD